MSLQLRDLQLQQAQWLIMRAEGEGLAAADRVGRARAHKAQDPDFYASSATWRS